MTNATKRLFQLAMPRTLDVTWKNYDGTATVYLTSDPTLNHITLTVTNSLDDPVKFPPGQPGPFGELPPGQSGLYLFFSGLLNNADLEGVVLSTDGWAIKSFVDEGTGERYLALAPTGGVPLAVGDTLTFTLGNLLASSSAQSGYVLLAVDGAVGVPDDETQRSVYVTVANPPKPGNKSLDLIVGFAENDNVFIGDDQHNELILFFTNPGDKPLVPGGRNAWGSAPPSFDLSFVYGDGQGALTTVDSAAETMHVNISDSYGNVWKKPEPRKQGELPYWHLEPDKDYGGNVLGTGANATIAFSITGIVTTLAQGLTYAYLGYKNIPGYNDGFYALEIVKVEPITVGGFTATPATITQAIAETEVTLKFEVANASYVTITNTPYARATTRMKFTDSIAVKVGATTTFTLVATNFSTGQQFAQPVEVRVSPDLFHLVPKGTIVMWSGSAQEIPQGWSLCNGENGTPDLVHRFIMGTAGSPQLKGGSKTHFHSAMPEVTILPNGAHAHHMPELWYDNGCGKGPITVIDRNARPVQGYMTRESEMHVHKAWTTVDIMPTENLPPWFALCFLIKTT